MALTTTTFAAIRDTYATALASGTPDLVPDRKLVRAKQSVRLRDWPAVATEAGFRAFEITRSGGEEPPLLDPAAYLRQEVLTVTAAYPLLLAIYGAADLDDVEKLIRSDARQIRDGLLAAGNYTSGQQGAIPLSLPEPERDNPEVWFQSISVTVYYYEAQALV